jgi:ABC-2 type transport system permease protein
MRLISVLRKSVRELARDRLTVLLSLSLAPFFVVLYWIFFGGGSTTYDVLVINQDTGPGGEQVIAAIEGITYSDGQSILDVNTVEDRAKAERQLKDRKATMLLIIPPNFSESLAGSGEPSTPLLVGDLTNPYYSMSAALVSAAVDSVATQGQPRPAIISEEALKGSEARTEFENYVPGLLIFAVGMLVFPVSMVVAREYEAGTLRRLQLTRITSFDLLGGISLSQVGMGVLSVIITFLLAVALGFESQGPLWVAIMVGAVTSLSVVGIGLLVACFCRTVNQAFLLSNFPLMLLMFFSGSIFPIPKITLFSIGGHSIGLFDFLPATHAVVALNKILTLGEGLSAVSYELSAVLILSVIYFAGGMLLFQRMRLR